MIRPSVPPAAQPESAGRRVALAVLVMLVACAAVASVVIGAVVLGRTNDCRPPGVATPQPIPRPGPTGGPLR